jgi:hypothetical protein
MIVLYDIEHQHIAVISDNTAQRTKDKSKGRQKKNEKKQPMYVRALFGQDWTFVHAR